MDDYARSRSERLQQQGFKPTQNWRERKHVSISEKGKTYIVPVGSNILTAVFQIDGVIIKSGRKCDNFLAALPEHASEKHGIAVFIELKGVDIGHAVDQLEDTLKNSLFIPYPKSHDKVRARIVTAGCGPKSSSRLKVEEARVRFKRLYNTELKLLKNSQADTILNP